MSRVRISLWTSIIFFSVLSFRMFSQAIPAYFFGQNAWMPDTIGTALYNGKLHKHWSNIKYSGTKLVRFGGISPDKNKPTNFQYIKMIDSIRSKGMEPVIQVPYHNGQYTVAQATAIVQYINITKGKNIKYWIIGNEPDLEYSFTNASQVAAYIKPFASAMKAVDPTILIIGPETAWFNQSIINGLTTPGGTDDITGKDAAGRFYVDVISFHYYPFNGTQTRSQVLTKLTQTGGLQDNLINLNTRLANCNAYHNRSGASALTSAITEANINYQNSSTDNLNGLGVNSFIGGQFVAEMLAVGMKNQVSFVNIWSVIEGNSQALNIGFLDRTTGAKKAMYYHYKMLADNFSGNFAGGTSNMPNVKTFGSKSTQYIHVMILNEELTGNLNYTVRLNTSSVTASSSLKLNINAGVAAEYSDNINNQTSVLLTFNTQGALLKKCIYSLADHAAYDLPPSCTEMSAPLPISMDEFYGATDNGVVFLNGRVRHSGGKRFLIERSLDGLVFDSLELVKNDIAETDPVSFQIKDHSPVKGLNYYRLAVTASDNSVSYSRITAVNFTGLAGGEVSIFPNPNDGKEFFLDAGVPENSHFQILVTDITGRSVPANYELTYHNGSRVVRILPVTELPRGIYLAILTSENTVYKGKFIVSKP